MLKSKHVSKYCAKLGSWCSASLIIKLDWFYSKFTWASWIHLESSSLTWSTLLFVSYISLSQVKIKGAESLWPRSVQTQHVRGFNIVIQQKNTWNQFVWFLLSLVSTHVSCFFFCLMIAPQGFGHDRPLSCLYKCWEDSCFEEIAV